MITFASPRYNAQTFVSPWSHDSIGVEFSSAVNGVSASAAWTANLTQYYPWWVMEPCIATEVIWLNGTAVAGNVTVGIYDSTSALVPGNLLVACAATAQSGTNATQTAALTDTVITPGLKWLAHHATSSSATFFRCNLTNLPISKSLCLCSQSVATTLPGTATPVSITSSAIPVFGIFISPRTLV